MTKNSNNSSEMPEPEVLKPQAQHVSEKTNPSLPEKKTVKLSKVLDYKRYKPSHKATFIGLAVVIGILLINGVVITFIMTRQNVEDSKANQQEVVISSDVLNQLGVSRSAIDSAGTELIVGPKATFNSSVTINGDASVAGQLKLNGDLSADNANFGQLSAGKTELSELNVNGAGTISDLVLRKDLTVQGTTKLQGAVNIYQLLTVSNNVNIVGNLSVGGSLTTRYFQASNLTADNSLTVGGHILTRGSAPSVSSGGAVGSNGTVSISGNDTSGTVAVNVGVGGGNGILAYISFVNSYGNIPHVVITSVGRGAGSIYVNRSANGFSIGVSNALSPGGYAFDYIIMQ